MATISSGGGRDPTCEKDDASKDESMEVAAEDDDVELVSELLCLLKDLLDEFGCGVEWVGWLLLLGSSPTL